MNTNNPIRITFAAVALMAALTTGVRAADEVPAVGPASNRGKLAMRDSH